MVQIWLAQIPLAIITPTSVQQYRQHLAYKLIHPSTDVQLTQWIQSSSQATGIHEPTNLPELTVGTQITQSRLRPRRTTDTTVQTPLPPTRLRQYFQIQDPASMYTYAAESTLTGAGWGLFASRLVGPDSPLDNGHVVGEYFGRELSEEEIRAYIQDPNPSINTGFMICFQGLAIDAWDHDKGTYLCMTALTNDCLDFKRYNSEWVKKTINGRPALYLEAHSNVNSHDEFFVEYGNLAFCRANFPVSTLFKAISHYYPQIITSAHDRDLWSRIPQARYLFNSPYHTLHPHQLPSILDTLQQHYNRCGFHCSCDLQPHLDPLFMPTVPQKRTKNSSSNSRKRQKTSPNIIPIPDSNNARYDQRLAVLPDPTLPGAGLGLFAIAPIKTGEIIGIYENYTGGKRLTSSRIKHPTHHSAYAVEHNGLVRDAWNPVLQQPCCKPAYANDSMNADLDNCTLAINPNFPMTLLLIATRDINPDSMNPTPIYLPYGGKYWCDDKYPLELLIQAIRRYHINIYTSTEDTDGDWTGLQKYPQLCLIFPAMTNADVIQEAERAQDSRIYTSTEPAALPVPDTKKRIRTEPETIKETRRRTMDYYITRRMPVENTTGGTAEVRNRLCNDVNACYDFSVASNNQHLNSEFLPSPNTSIYSTVNEYPRDSDIEKTKQHDKRYVFI